MLEMAVDVIVEIHQPDGVCNDMWKSSQSEVRDECSTSRSCFTQFVFAQLHFNM